MADAAYETLFPDIASVPPPVADHSTGILPSQAIREAIHGREVLAPDPIVEDQIQPASLDLRLGRVAYRVPASFLPGRDATVMDKIRSVAMYDLDLAGGAVLERGGVYIVPLQESIAFRKRTSAAANPKSSTGRLDIFARVITDHATEFDRVREQYKGPLYAEISPRSFTVRVCRGTRLVQLRIRRGSPPFSDAALRRLHGQVALVGAGAAQANIDRGLTFTVDVRGDPATGLIGYKARNHASLIDLEKLDYYEPRAFWEPVYARTGGGIVLDPDDFYILASREAVMVPVDHAAEMMAYDATVGEFRVHYAGFFDPGFGHHETGGHGTRAVLEVRSHEVPFLIEDQQVVGRLVYERLTAVPDKLYGRGIGSNYQHQGLTLGKQFRRQR